MERILALLAALLIPSFALAAPEDVNWLKHGTTDLQNSVSPGQTSSIVFGPGSNDSKILTINASKATLCFLPDTLASGGTARITVYKSVTYTPSDLGRIIMPLVPFDGDDCLELDLGKYWFEILPAASSGDSAIVTVTGRGS